jgi:hypothetical protein
MKEFFKKYNKSIRFVIVNTFLLLMGLLLLHRVSFIDITLLIPLKYFWLVILYLVSFYVFSYYQGCGKKEREGVERVLKYIFLFVLFLITLNFLNFVIKSPVKTLFPFNNMGLYLNHMLLISGVCLLVFKRDYLKEMEKKEEERKEDKKKFDWYEIAFFIVIVLYLIIQFSMFRYKGGYPDEFRHILAGKTLFEEGVFPKITTTFGQKGYVRGAPISYLIAILFSIFRVSNDVAKLAPITLGFINLFLLNGISGSILKNKKVRILSLLLYVFSSWLIFMHFYIRHYVFLEFSFIFTVFLFVKIEQNTIKKYKTVLYLTLLLLINSINYFFMYDSIGYIIPFVSLFGLIYIFLYKVYQLKINLPSFKKTFKLNRFHKLLLLLLIGIIVFLISSNFINYKSLLHSLMNKQTNTADGHYNFNTFFLGLYSFFFIFFIFGIFSNFLSKKNHPAFFLFLPAMLLHYLSTISLQIMRVLVYLLPIFFILSFYGLENILKIFKKRYLKVLIFLLFIFCSIIILHSDRKIIFPGGSPIYPKEIGYDEYEPMYAYIKENFDDYILINTEYTNQKEVLYGVTTDYRLDFRWRGQSCGTYMYEDQNGVCRQYYVNTPTITNRDDFYNILLENRVCILLRNYANHFLESSDLRKIKSTMELKKSFIGYDIYCND